MSIKINHLQHIGIPISNIERSREFYERLGFKPVMRSTFDHEGAEGKVAMMKHGKVIVELYQMPEPELSEVKKRKDGRIDHVAFDVSDIDETFTTLKSKGFEILEDSPVFLNFWKKGCRYFNISGPDGERLEFCQIL
ncbi:VOC family protein [Sunxiuqinia sp. A32]|uniref:VOC family protein n=1 Tax=Sunxiuqinia sp. A32 TaxID=3461496 RepID=UPI004045F4F7